MSGYSLSNDSLIKSGLFKYYNEDGVLTSQGNYDQNHKTGLWKTFYPGGQLHISQSYNENGKIEGGFIVYYKNSKIRRSDHYKNGDIIDGKCFTKSGNDTSWYPFQIKPEFIGGEKERIKYLKENIIYPQEAREYGIQGNVNVSFIVEIDGRIDDVELMSSSNRLLDEEALRVIRKMPHWKPGQLDGKPVKVQINLPVAFKLN